MSYYTLVCTLAPYPVCVSSCTLICPSVLYSCTLPCLCVLLHLTLSVCPLTPYPVCVYCTLVPYPVCVSSCTLPCLCVLLHLTLFVCTVLLYLTLSVCPLVPYPVCVFSCTLPCLCALLYLTLSVCPLAPYPVCVSSCTLPCRCALLHLTLSVCTLASYPVCVSSRRCQYPSLPPVPHDNHVVILQSNRNQVLCKEGNIKLKQFKYAFGLHYHTLGLPTCTVKSHFKALGLYNFIRGFGWAFKRGVGALEAELKNVLEQRDKTYLRNEFRLTYYFLSYIYNTFIMRHNKRRIYFKNMYKTDLCD